MPLLAGTRLGAYDIIEPLGAGGMGEVYRARDSRLGRDVAVKVLREDFTCDPERVARFRREACVLASLNHSNIASIYGLEESGGIHHLIMELVPGETLAQQLIGSALPIEGALTIHRQIAEALELAHAKGIVHRDLKPANIKITPERKVKVLDFGLAKAVQVDPRPDGSSLSPTVTDGYTREGMILGTPAYMSPEQVRGEILDKRTDIWSFGCVLYEALTARPAFSGGSVSDVLAAVLRSEPDWSLLPANTPPNIARLIRRCLQKTPERRLHDIADARLEIDEAETDAPPASLETRTARKSYPLLAAALLAGALIAGVSVWAWMRSGRATATVEPAAHRLVIRLPDGDTLALAEWAPLSVPRPSLAISPDGTRLAYTAERNHIAQLMLRSMHEFEAKPVPGTNGAFAPFFSPDSRWVGFFAEGKLRKVSTEGGEPVTLGDVHLPFEASWGTGDTILFSDDDGRSLWRVSSEGGPLQLFSIAEEIGHRHRLGAILPDGKSALITANADIAVVSLENGRERLLIRGGSAPSYSYSGHLVFVREGSLWAAPFDPSALQVTGPAVHVLDGVRVETSAAAQYTLASDGTLVYVPGSGVPKLELVWADPHGEVKPLGAPVRRYRTFRLSPDGRRLAIGVQGDGDDEIWIYDLVRGAFTRLTVGGRNDYPIWTPDGRRVIFTSSRGGATNLYWMAADGSSEPEALLKSEQNQYPYSCSPDGQLVAYMHRVDSGAGSQIWILPLNGDRRPQLFLGNRSFNGQPAFSSDGRWLAYVSDESGKFEVYVRPYPGPGGKRQISTAGGEEPTWSANGRELFYRNGQKWMVATVRTQPDFAAESPRLLIQGPYTNVPGISFGVHPDGRLLLLRSIGDETGVSQLNVVLNWFAELRRRVAVRK